MGIIQSNSLRKARQRVAMPDFESMVKYSAGYAHSNNNFVIQNLPQGNCPAGLCAAICILRNILQRGNPTIPSKFLQSHLGAIHKEEDHDKICYPLISSYHSRWRHTIRGDDQGNYYPARRFHEELLPKFLEEYAFVVQLLVPEVPINHITQIDTEEYRDQQVDFYLPQAFLVVEIDGIQHDLRADAVRVEHLHRHGIQTIRITAEELESQGQAFANKIEDIKNRIRKSMHSQEERKENDHTTITLSDYAIAHAYGIDLGKSNYQATAVIRFQLLVLELLERGILELGEKWNFAIRCPESAYPFDLAVHDNLLWLSHILKLQKIPFSPPIVDILNIGEWEESPGMDDRIRVDFSLRDRYTDENVHNPELIFMRSDYFEHYRHFRKSNSNTLEFSEIRPYDYFRLSTTRRVEYRLRFGGADSDESSLLFLAENIFLQECGSPAFNDGQLPIIDSALSGADTLGLLPTGGGKSLCFQLCAFLQPCLSFVVVPIKALMTDQVAELSGVGISRVSSISSDDEAEAKQNILQAFSQGKFQLIYLSPERFQSKDFRSSFGSAISAFKMGYAVIDEIHCLSEWGHDFRTSYLNLVKTIRRLCPDAMFIGLTATASRNVLEDIKMELNILEENVKTLLDYTRKELEFKIISTEISANRLIAVLDDLHSRHSVFLPRDKDSRCVLVFTQTVNGKAGCSELSSRLSQHFKQGIGYFCGSAPKKASFPEGQKFETYKKDIQKKFKKNEMPVLVATKAFGMGVNKPNIIATIHSGMPSSMESFYQEGGRAGRDKKLYVEEKARCILLFTPPKSDIDGIWNKEMQAETLKAAGAGLPSNCDLNTSLFLLTKNLVDIQSETRLMKDILSAIPNSESKIMLRGSDFSLPPDNAASEEVPRDGINRAQLEKSIYHLSLLGVIKDWTIESYFDGGAIEVSVLAHDTDIMVKALQKTIRKYEVTWTAEGCLESNSDEGKIDYCIRTFLQWSYSHFVYNRRQSLKSIHDLCLQAVKGDIDSLGIKQRLEAYFKFSKTSFMLQHIAEHPWDFGKWFELLMKATEDGSDGQDRGQVLVSVQMAIARYLESYRDNVGLDLISGMTRLALDQADDADGRRRLQSALSLISESGAEQRIEILERITTFAHAFNLRHRNELSRLIISAFQDLEPAWTYQRLEDEYSLGLALEKIIGRLNILKERLHA